MSRTILALSAAAFLCASSQIAFADEGGTPTPASEASAQDPSAQFVGPFWKYTKNDICLQRYPFQEANSFPWWFCMQNRDADPTVLLLGDSSANALYPGFAHNYALKAQTILSVGICGPGEDSTKGCSEQTQFIKSIIAADRSLKYVIMRSSFDISDSISLSRLINSIDYAENHGATVILFNPQLELPYDIKSCVPPHNAHSCEVDVGERAKLDRYFQPVLHLLESRPEVLIFDQNDLFCDVAKCSLMRNDMPLLRDEYRHLSEY
jgi:hypothetical protein